MCRVLCVWCVVWHAYPSTPLTHAFSSLFLDVVVVAATQAIPSARSATTPITAWARAIACEPISFNSRQEEEEEEGGGDLRSLQRETTMKASLSSTPPPPRSLRLFASLSEVGETETTKSAVAGRLFRGERKRKKSSFSAAHPPREAEEGGTPHPLLFTTAAHHRQNQSQQQQQQPCADTV